MGISYHELDIWKQGYELLLEVAEIATLFPDIQRYALAVQLHKSANSIIANIAESHGRYHYADKVRVLYISRGELVETRSHLRVAMGLKYISNDQFDTLDKQYEKLQKDMSNYIAYLSKKS